MSASDAPMNIGEVLERLVDEFPDVTISKLRYLESKGLVRPDRSPAGYRRYTDDDVARLTWVLRQQRDRFIPLKVIAEMLAEGQDVDQAEGDGDMVPAFRERVSQRATGAGSGSLAERAYMVGLDEAVVVELERIGLLEGRPAGKATVYDDDAVLVARVAACFLDHGLDVRHLRGYLVAAQREAGLLEQVVKPLAAGHGDDGASVAELRRRVDVLLDAGSALHELLLRREMGDLGR